MHDTAAECVECGCTMAPAWLRASYMARCKNASLDGGSPASSVPLSSIFESRAGSSVPRQLLVGVSSQPSSVRTLILPLLPAVKPRRSEEHTSELQSLMRISYAVFCLKKNRTLHTYILHIS